MSRKKRNKQVAEALDNQNEQVDIQEKKIDINESERIQRAEWMHNQVKIQREREDETWEKIMQEQRVITERMRSIDDDISRNRELERYHEGCLEDITDQVYSLHGVTTDKLEGMTQYKNAKFQGEATIIFGMSIVIAAFAAYAYDITSQICMFMLLCVGAEGALLSGPHKKRNLLGGIFRGLFFVPIILMAAEVTSFKYYENYYEYVTTIGEIAALLLVIIGTSTYFIYNPYRKDKKYVKAAQADLKDLHKVAKKNVIKNQRIRVKNEEKEQKIQAKLAKKEAKVEKKQQKHKLKLEKREFKSAQKKEKAEMKTELKRSKLMAKAMKINKKAGIMPDIKEREANEGSEEIDNAKTSDTLADSKEIIAKTSDTQTDSKEINTQISNTQTDSKEINTQISNTQTDTEETNNIKINNIENENNIISITKERKVE